MGAAAFLALKTAENEESCPQDIDWKELISDILTEVMLKMANGQYPPIVSKETTNRNMNTLINEMTSYLMQCYARSHQEEKDQKKRATVPPLSDALLYSRTQIINYTSLVIQGIFDPDAPHPKLPHSPLYKPLMDTSIMPAGFIVDLITITSNNGWEEFKTVFSPLTTCLVMEGRSSSIVDATYRPSLMALTELCEIKVGTNNRPICQLLIEMEEWLPAEVAQGCGGREMTAVSILGPYLGITVFTEDDSTVAEKFFNYPPNEKPTQATIRSLTSQFQSEMELLRKNTHQLLHAILVNNKSRDAALSFLQEVLVRNAKRQQLQVQERFVAADGFMLNFLSVMQHLSSKVKMGQVDVFYLHSSKSRVNISEDTRLNMTTKEAEEWVETLNKSESFKWKDPNFHTECWHLTLLAHHLSILPCIRRYQRRLRAIREIHKMIEELEKTESTWSRLPIAGRNKAMLQKWKKELKKLNQSKYCADIGLLDPALFQRCFQFYSSVTEFLFMSLAQKTAAEEHKMKEFSPEDFDEGETSTKKSTKTITIGAITVKFPMNSDSGTPFSSLPEWIVEDMADFALFSLQYFPNVISDYLDHNMLTFILCVVCTPHYFKNPYLVSKLIEILFVINPAVQDKTGEMYARIMSHYISQEHLPSSLMRFYTEVEQTGSSNEFYDKFTIRYHISIIMKSMWESPTGVHKMAIVHESANGKNFIKFINMMMNDTTFLLDESLDALKRIHEVQEDMGDPAKWAAQSQEQQTSRARQLGQDERQCRSYLTLARETVDMFHYLTEGIKEPFLRPELADRLAAMLDAVLEQLTNGPKCRNLKVKNPEKYSWDPKWLLSHLIDIYLHLDSPKLTEAIANDQRAFKLSTFQDTARRMEATLGRSPTDVAQFSALGEAANKLVVERMKQEVEWDNVPGEFECAIMGELMQDPVILPSGNRCDRKNIERHILSTPNDPFNRQPLTEDMLKPDLELKAQIDNWKTEQMRAVKKS